MKMKFTLKKLGTTILATAMLLCSAWADSWTGIKGLPLPTKERPQIGGVNSRGTLYYAVVVPWKYLDGTVIREDSEKKGAKGSYIGDGYGGALIFSTKNLKGKDLANWRSYASKDLDWELKNINELHLEGLGEYDSVIWDHLENEFWLRFPTETALYAVDTEGNRLIIKWVSRNGERKMDFHAKQLWDFGVIKGGTFRHRGDGQCLLLGINPYYINDIQADDRNINHNWEIGRYGVNLEIFTIHMYGFLQAKCFADKKANGMNGKYAGYGLKLHNTYEYLSKDTDLESGRAAEPIEFSTAGLSTEAAAQAHGHGTSQINPEAIKKLEQLEASLGGGLADSGNSRAKWLQRIKDEEKRNAAKAQAQPEQPKALQIPQVKRTQRAKIDFDAMRKR